MANMSYCRFENTSGDLADCVCAMEEAGSFKELDLNSYEKSAFSRMVDLCERFLEEAQRLTVDEMSEEDELA